LDHIAKRMALSLLDEGVNVVRHDAPSDKSVPLIVRMQQSAFDDLTARFAAEKARPMPGVE